MLYVFISALVGLFVVQAKIRTDVITDMMITEYERKEFVEEQRELERQEYELEQLRRERELFQNIEPQQQEDTGE